MLSPDLQARLSRINRRRSLPALPPAAATVPSSEVAASGTSPVATAVGGERDWDSGPCLVPAPVPEDVSTLPCGREIETAAGPLWEIAAPLATLWPAGPAWLEQTERLSLDDEPHDELRLLADHLASGSLVLDLETCGFAGSMVFLTGVIRCDSHQATLHQLFARNYAEERAMLLRLWELAADCELLVTFNGKTFDWPSTRDRMLVHRVAGRGALSAEATPHCDLLHHCRRRWKRRLPNCRLQTLERHLCRRERHEDIPGRDIPDAYHDFVRSGDARQIRRILHHNALDLVTLLQLSVRMLNEEPLSETSRA